MSNKTTCFIDSIIARNQLSEEEKELLVALRAIVSGEKQEYYTDEMFKVFYEHANILSLPPEEASSILAPFYETLNLKNCNAEHPYRN